MGYRDKHGIHPLVIYISKKCQTLEFWLSQQTPNPFKFDVDKHVTSTVPFWKWVPQLLSYTNLYLSLSSVICLSYFKHDSFSLSVLYCPPCYPTDLLCSLPDASDLSHS